MAALLLVAMSAPSRAGESPLFQTNFPYQSACVGAVFPAGNVAYKGVAIRLGNNAFMCFDTDLLRMSAGWTDGYLTPNGVAFNGNHGGNPQINGPQKFGTSKSPGWADANGSFSDPRRAPYGPIPSAWGRWDGLYVQGDEVVLGYTVQGAKIHEFPTSIVADGATGFVRTFQIKSAAKPLGLLVCEAGTNSTSAVDGGVARVVDAAGVVTKVALVNAPKGAFLEMAGNQVVLRLSQKVRNGLFSVLVWNGPAADEAKFAGLLKFAPRMPDFGKGGPVHWPEEVVTKGVLGKGEGSYVVDTLTPPTENPWKRRVRLAGVDFFKDGKRAALCTWDGDIWIVSGIDQNLEKLTWKRYASGGYETLGLKIVGEDIYTSGRDQITRYRDLNKDGEADYYENFNNEITSSQGFHEFVFDLQTGPDGSFYFAKASPVKGGGRGFGGGGGNGEITEHAGSVLKVSKDGKKFEVYATGFRAPNGIGVSPTGQVTTGDNEGTWVPACPLNWVRKGGFYGVEDTAHQIPVSDFKQPLCWLSHNDFDNSGGGQVWVTSDKWGLPKGELLHLSYGICAIYRVLPQDVDGQMQGGVVRIPANFTSSAMRAKFNPTDGQLYVTGLQGWQTKAAKITGLDRVRYTGKAFNSVAKLVVDKGGIHLTFSEPLNEKEAADLQNYSIKRWNYHRTSDYGSADWSVANPEKKGRDTVEVTSATLSKDGRTVTLQVPDLKPVMQMQIDYSLKTKNGEAIEQKVLHTINVVPEVSPKISMVN